MSELLRVENLSVAFRTRGGIVRALETVSFSIARGETVALVGESGSGKSVTAYAAMGILDPAGQVTGGRIMFDGIDLTEASEREIEDLRGREMSMIFQNPRAALNPIRRIGTQIADVLLRHGNIRRADAPAEAVRLLAQVGIPDPARRARAYPFELSGGMCQRVMIAIALACAPSLLIADEPTTGLDVTTQAVAMDLVRDLARERQMATLLITHDLALASEYCDRVVVMHAGHVVESGPVAELLAAPRHPYTARLLAATPRPGIALGDLAAIPGELPDLRRAAAGVCRFAGRCDRRRDDCAGSLPPIPPGPLHDAACWNPL
ncbi:MAG: ABC transporter ATP-binding protein [Ferrovibrionaceae bacterium]